MDPVSTVALSVCAWGVAWYCSYRLIRKEGQGAFVGHLLGSLLGMIACMATVLVIAASSPEAPPPVYEYVTSPGPLRRAEDIVREVIGDTSELRRPHTRQVGPLVNDGLLVWWQDPEECTRGAIAITNAALVRHLFTHPELDWVNRVDVLCTCHVNDTDYKTADWKLTREHAEVIIANQLSAYETAEYLMARHEDGGVHTVGVELYWDTFE